MTADVCGSEQPVKPLVDACHVAQQQQALLLCPGGDACAGHPRVEKEAVCSCTGIVSGGSDARLNVKPEASHRLRSHIHMIFS